MSSPTRRSGELSPPRNSSTKVATIRGFFDGIVKKDLGTDDLATLIDEHRLGDPITTDAAPEDIAGTDLYVGNHRSAEGSDDLSREHDLQRPGVPGTGWGLTPERHGSRSCTALPHHGG